MKRNLRRPWRLMLALAAMLIIVAAPAAWWLPGYAEREILRRLAEAGLGPATGRLESLSPWSLVMADLRLGEAGWIRVGRVEAHFSPAMLWRGEVDQVAISRIEAAAFEVDGISIVPALRGWEPIGEHRIVARRVVVGDVWLGGLGIAFSLPDPARLELSMLTLTGSRLGTLTVDPVTIDLVRHTLHPTVRIEGADLAEVLRLTLGDDATGRGTLDGWLHASVHVVPPYRFLVRGGELRARPEAELRVRNEQGLRDLLGASVGEPRVRDELVVALRDFEASRLEATLAPQPEAPLRLRLVGQGGPIRRPVDLTLNLHGISDVGNTPLLDYLLEGATTVDP